jgi:hypothetical protein
MGAALVTLVVVTSPATTLPGHDPELRPVGTCRDCGAEFVLPISFVGRVGRSKWSSLCPSCVHFEL